MSLAGGIQRRAGVVCQMRKTGCYGQTVPGLCGREGVAKHRVSTRPTAVGLFDDHMKTTTLPNPEASASHIPAVSVNVASFDEPWEADQLVRLMKDVHIDASLKDDRKLQQNWFLVRQPRAGVHVQVPEPDLVVAQTFLRGNPAAQRLFLRAVHCPACDSGRVQFPQMTRRNVLPTLIAHTLVFLGFMRQEYYCEDCHFSWTPSDPPPNKKA